MLCFRLELWDGSHTGSKDPCSSLPLEWPGTTARSGVFRSEEQRSPQIRKRTSCPGRLPDGCLGTHRGKLAHSGTSQILLWSRKTLSSFRLKCLTAQRGFWVEICPDGEASATRPGGGVRWALVHTATWQSCICAGIADARS